MEQSKNSTTPISRSPIPDILTSFSATISSDTCYYEKNDKQLEQTLQDPAVSRGLGNVVIMIVVLRSTVESLCV